MDKAEQFLIETNTYHKFCRFCMEKTFENLNRKLIHSDRWSMVYDWLHDGKFNGIKIPDGIETLLTDIWEIRLIHIKKEN